MAISSSRFQRVTLYSLLFLAMILVYQIYHHGGKLLSKNQQERKDDWTKHLQSNHVKLSRTKAAIESPQPIRRDLKKTAEQGNPILQMEVKRLKTRINRKDSLIEKLTAQLEKEKSRAEKLNQVIGNLKVENTQLQAEVESYSNGVTSGRSEQNTGLKKELGSLIKTSPKISDIHISQRIPFESFAKTHLFEYSPKKKPKEYIFHGQNSNTRRVKSGERHLVQAQDIGVNFINTNTSYHVSRENMVDGVYRIDINTGIDYELYFKDPSANKFITVRLIRPLGVLQPVALPEDNRGPNELINLIVPLSGRLERFQQFMDMFVEVCIKIDKNVFLTVVLYGASDFNTVKTTLKDLEVTYGFKKYQLIMRDKPFSRGRALHDGVMYWSSSPKNVLMFFCDVDITIRPDFLRRCRMYTQRKEKIYYPMVFSLFNPKNVYEQGTIPPPAEKLKIGKKLISFLCLIHSVS